MDFELNEDQQQLASLAHSFVKRESPVSRFRKLRADPVGFRRQMWQRMGEMGWLGLPFPATVGGIGASAVELSLLFEAFGTTLVPEPFLESVVLAGLSILRAGTALQHTRWLTPLVEGRTTLGLAWSEQDSRFDVSRVATRATRRGDGYLLHGQKRWVLNGHAADAIVVSARTSGGEADAAGISLFVVDRDTPGLVIQPVRTMDGRHAAMLRFEGMQVDADRLLGSEGHGAAVLERVMDHGVVAACAEAVGIMSTLLAMTTDYLRTREQFGVKIGSFQALQHRAVDMFVETEIARSVSLMATLMVDEPDDTERLSALSAAKAQIAASGRFVSQQAIQLHGGIGITDEHDVGLYFKRMHVLATLFGDEEYHLARFASQPSFAAGA